MPEPVAVVLLKLLVIPRRRDRSKVEKVLYTARALGVYLLNNTERRGRLNRAEVT